MAGKRLAKFGEKGATESKPQRRAEWLAKGWRNSRKRRYRESKPRRRAEWLAKIEKKALPRVELGTFALRVRRSTAKLQRQILEHTVQVYK